MGVYQIEEWKPVVGYEGLYEVSNTGRVRSTFRYCRELKQSQRTTYRSESVVNTNDIKVLVVMCGDLKGVMTYW